MVCMDYIFFSDAEDSSGRWYVRWNGCYIEHAVFRLFDFYLGYPGSLVYLCPYFQWEIQFGGKSLFNYDGQFYVAYNHFIVFREVYPLCFYARGCIPRA